MRMADFSFSRAFGLILLLGVFSRAAAEPQYVDVAAAAGYLARMFSGMGDEAAVRGKGESAAIEQTGLRIARGLAADEAELVLTCWAELWRGAISSQRQLKTLSWQRQDDLVRWTITPRTA
jgi:hypothetical protein